MTRIAALELALPAHSATQEEVRELFGAWLARRVEDPGRILEIIANAGVERRFSVGPPQDIFSERPFAERNDRYIEASAALGEQVARATLESADLPPDRVGLVATVSCTGFMIPSVDAHLANSLPLSRHVRRLPITELGCAAGAMGLSRVDDFLTARPDEHGLLVSVELPSLSFQPGDTSMAHLVSCALFGDGAAGVALAGEDTPLVRARPELPRITATRTRFFHDTLEYMGFEVRDSGFHMVLDARIPRLIDEQIWPAVGEFLADEELTLDDIDHVLPHPGGRRILDTIEALLGRGPEALAHSRRALADYGNLSSGSVLALLRDFIRGGHARPGDRALVMAFGPGFNAEMLILEWPPCAS